MYHQTFKEPFHQRIEYIQYNALIAITGAIRGIFSEKIYLELGLKSIRSSRWLRKLCLFYKINKSKSTFDLYSLIRHRVKYDSTAESSQINNISYTKTRSKFFIFFFPSSVIDC